MGPRPFAGDRRSTQADVNVRATPRHERADDRRAAELAIAGALRRPMRASPRPPTGAAVASAARGRRSAASSVPASGRSGVALFHGVVGRRRRTASKRPEADGRAAGNVASTTLAAGTHGDGLRKRYLRRASASLPLSASTFDMAATARFLGRLRRVRRWMRISRLASPACWVAAHALRLAVDEFAGPLDVRSGDRAIICAKVYLIYCARG